MKQTAVEWLAQQLQAGKELSTVLSQAKELERRQIIEAYNDGQAIPPFDYAEKYYDRNYKSTKK